MPHFSISENERPFISIIIPTHNRAGMLSLTLDTMLAQNYPKDRFEIIVCDNNSNDGTAEVVKKYASNNLDKIRSIFEIRQGVHYARNAAAHQARGDLLYYTDDDMLAERNVLKVFASFFAHHPQVGSATGKVLPKWESTPPDWILQLCINGNLSLNDLGDSELVGEKSLGIYSCHQAMRREVFFSAGGFNPENTAGEWIGDGETGLNLKIGKLGFLFGYAPEAVTWHMIPKSRMTQKYLVKRLANQGNCDSYTEYRANKFSMKQLAANMVMHSLNAERFQKLYEAQLRDGDIQWHMSLARVHYYLSRFKYDKRLATDAKWRDMVLRDDWLHVAD